MLKIHHDSLSRRLYANDASMYEEIPAGVCFPKNTEELIQLISLAQRKKTSITARAAGTSLAGQTTGKGIIADISRHMTHILNFNPQQKEMRVQPGVIRDDVNRTAAAHNLLFGPDTSTTNRCMIGGMIGNNSSGSYSIKYGTTRQHIKRLTCVLSDGSLAEIGPLTDEELDKKCRLDNFEGRIYREMTALIEKYKNDIVPAFPHPEIIRRNTGYALDALCLMSPFTTGGPKFNLSELLCGSEGTLAFTTDATLNLVPLQNHKILLVPHFHSLDEAMKATVEIVAQNPAAVELIDHHILSATKDNPEQNRNRFFLDGEPRYLLLVECLGDSKEEVAQKTADIMKVIDRAYSCPVLTDAQEMKRAWDLRKAGLGLLMGKVSKEKSPTFVEDTAVRVQDLPTYISDYQEIMRRHNTDCVYYAHASVGELHLRPVLDLKTQQGISTMKHMAEEIADLVAKYRGSLSGEHGDGRARSTLLERVLGKTMMPLLAETKRIWDPQNIFNPGIITSPEPIDSHLRFYPGYKDIQVDTVFQWRKSHHSFGEALEMCNGAGVCRKTERSGGTMCPSYMATKEEKDSTRGRANVLRTLFSSSQSNAFSSQEIKDALKLCLSCKACKSECPANVDMAAMKAEFLHGWHTQNRPKASDLFFGNATRLYPLASNFPALSNFIANSGPGKEILHTFFNVHKHRNLPAFASKPFHKSRKKTPTRQAKSVVLLVDYFTNYHSPQIASAAENVLHTLGYNVIAVAPFDTSRSLISRGFLEHAKNKAVTNIHKLAQFVDAGIPVVGLEPSEVLTIRDEYLDFFPDGELHQQALEISRDTFLFEEFIGHQNSELLDTIFQPANKTVLVHPHCHFKALTDGKALPKALSAAGYIPQVVDAGCCGMAGSFGYDADTYKVSMQIGKQRLFPEIYKNNHDIICAHGFSCTHQIADGTEKSAFHPAELLAEALKHN